MFKAAPTCSVGWIQLLSSACINLFLLYTHSRCTGCQHQKPILSMKITRVLPYQQGSFTLYMAAKSPAIWENPCSDIFYLKNMVMEIWLVLYIETCKNCSKFDLLDQTPFKLFWKGWSNPPKQHQNLRPSVNTCWGILIFNSGISTYNFYSLCLYMRKVTMQVFVSFFIFSFFICSFFICSFFIQPMLHNYDKTVTTRDLNAALSDTASAPLKTLHSLKN